MSAAQQQVGQQLACTGEGTADAPYSWSAHVGVGSGEHALELPAGTESTMLARLIHSLWGEGNPLKTPPPRPLPRPSTLLACFDGAVAGYSPSIADQQPAGSAQQHGGPQCSHQPCTRDAQGAALR